MTDLKVGQHVAFRQTGLSTGVILEVDPSGRYGRGELRLKGTGHSRSTRVAAAHALRIPGPDEVIVSRAELKQLEANSDMLNRLQAAGVDNWEYYGEALKGAFEDDDEEGRD